jgi:hypothetical protein
MECLHKFVQFIDFLHIFHKYKRYNDNTVLQQEPNWPHIFVNFKEFQKLNQSKDMEAIMVLQ